MPPPAPLLALLALLSLALSWLPRGRPCSSRFLPLPSASSSSAALSHELLVLPSELFLSSAHLSARLFLQLSPPAGPSPLPAAPEGDDSGEVLVEVQHELPLSLSSSSSLLSSLSLPSSSSNGSFFSLSPSAPRGEVSLRWSGPAPAGPQRGVLVLQAHRPGVAGVGGAVSVRDSPFVSVRWLDFGEALSPDSNHVRLERAGPRVARLTVRVRPAGAFALSAESRLACLSVVSKAPSPVVGDSDLSLVELEFSVSSWPAFDPSEPDGSTRTSVLLHLRSLNGSVAERVFPFPVTIAASESPRVLLSHDRLTLSTVSSSSLTVSSLFESQQPYDVQASVDCVSSSSSSSSPFVVRPSSVRLQRRGESAAFTVLADPAASSPARCSLRLFSSEVPQLRIAPVALSLLSSPSDPFRLSPSASELSVSEREAVEYSLEAQGSFQGVRRVALSCADAASVSFYPHSTLFFTPEERVRRVSVVSSRSGLFALEHRVSVPDEEGGGVPANASSPPWSLVLPLLVVEDAPLELLLPPLPPSTPLSVPREGSRSVSVSLSRAPRRSVRVRSEAVLLGVPVSAPLSATLVVTPSESVLTPSSWSTALSLSWSGLSNTTIPVTARVFLWLEEEDAAELSASSSSPWPLPLCADRPSLMVSAGVVSSPALVEVSRAQLSVSVGGSSEYEVRVLSFPPLSSLVGAAPLVVRLESSDGVSLSPSTLAFASAGVARVSVSLSPSASGDLFVRHSIDGAEASSALIVSSPVLRVVPLTASSSPRLVGLPTELSVSLESPVRLELTTTSPLRAGALVRLSSSSPRLVVSPHTFVVASGASISLVGATVAVWLSLNDSASLWPSQHPLLRRVSLHVSSNSSELSVEEPVVSVTLLPSSSSPNPQTPLLSLSQERFSLSLESPEFSFNVSLSAGLRAPPAGSALRFRLLFSRTQLSLDPSELSLCASSPWQLVRGRALSPGALVVIDYELLGRSEPLSMRQLLSVVRAGCSCPAGEYFWLGACRACPVGHWCSSCAVTACAVGTYNSVTRSTSSAACGSCGGGANYCPQSGASARSACPAGHSCSASAANACAAGSAGTGGGCTACVAPTYAPAVGLSSCLPCPLGRVCTSRSAPPTTCPPGQRPAPDQRSCVACASGSACQGSSSAACPAGSLSSGGGASCASCPAGSYCPLGATSGSPCPAGTYSSGGSVVSCTACPSGYYQSATGRSSCTACPSGSWCTATTSTVCTTGTFSLGAQSSCAACPAGSTSTSPFTSCVPCAAGKQCSNPASPATCGAGLYSLAGATACRACPSGLTPNTARDSCALCPAGSYCPSGAAAPLACPSGSYSLLGSHSTCESCPSGFYCPSTSSSPVQCAAGSYSAANATTCTVCPAGKSCLTLSPTTCPDGSYSSASMLTCAPCPAGHWCTLGMDNGACALGKYAVDGKACVDCPAMHACPSPEYQPVRCPPSTVPSADKATCRPCAVGSVCTSTGTETACAAGSYALPGFPSCVPCPRGFSCPTAGSTPQICALGSYSASGATACTTCPAGSYCTLTDRHPCEKGAYSSSGATACPACPAGSSCAVASVAPVACASGQYSPSGSTACLACPSGSACLLPSLAPFPCEPGTLVSPDKTRCVECPAHSYCPSPSAASATPCAAGSFSPPGSISCRPCPAGTFCSGTAYPEECAAGEYSTSGQSSCTACPAGQSCTPQGHTATCPLGTYSPARTLACRVCPPGQFCANPATAPVACATGAYSLAGQTACTSCPPGSDCSLAHAFPHHCPATQYGATGATCVVCRNGALCPSTLHQKSEIACPEGGYCVGGQFLPCPEGYIPKSPGGLTAVSLATGCTACVAGEYCPKGARAATTCPAGFFCGAMTITPCPSGTYGPSSGLKTVGECLACPAGSFCREGSNSTLISCPLGYYCLQGATVPTPCAGGSFGSRVGLTKAESCTPCPIGFFCPPPVGGVASSPRFCRLGSYSSTVGATACTTCPAGSECFFVGMPTASYSCPAGYRCTGGTTKVRCAAGTYSSTGSSSCPACPAGYYCPLGTGVVGSLPIPCPVGKYCPTGSGTPTNCPGGSYGSQERLKLVSECSPCPAGSYCSGTGSVVPDGICQPGSYCPPSSNVPTMQPCPAGTYSTLSNLTHVDQCYSCPPGFYCLERCSSPVPCPAGTYRLTPGGSAAGSCANCPEGSYCPSQSIHPLDCGVGYYSPGRAAHCVVCPAGSFCSSNRTESSKLGTTYACPAGLFCPTSIPIESHFNKDMCPSGSATCTSGVMIVPVPALHSCRAGYYCPTRTATEQPCAAGKYNPVTGRGQASDCLQTPAGYYSYARASSVAGPCPPGSYCVAGTGDGTIASCPLGTYRHLPGARSVSDCSRCPPGFFCGVKTVLPTQCPAGRYCPMGTHPAASGVAASRPINCPAGSYGSTGGLRKADDCTPCPAGSYCLGTGNTRPDGKCTAGYICYERSWTPTPTDGVQGVECPAGGYCPTGSSRALPCPEGSYNDLKAQTDASKCKPCGPGKYCQGTASSTYTGLCAAGYYCPGGASTPYQNKTGLGHYSPEGAWAPTQCPPGTFASQPGMALCAPCLAGSYCPVLGLSTTTVCRAGSYCPAGSTNPTPCPAGTYSNKPALQSVDQCTSCDPGKYCQGTGKLTPTGLCDAGYYCKGGASTRTPTDVVTGERCPKGYYCESGAYLPTPCPSGTYNPNLGLKRPADCLACPAGQYCNAMLVAPDGQCSAGFFCKTGAPFPEPPDRGTDFGLCPVGHYCPVGTSTPVKCAMGTYTNRRGSKTCLACPAGYFCDGATTDRYGPCRAGSYCPAGTTSYVACPAGTFSTGVNLQSASQCTPCTAGKACTVAGLTAPDKTCSAGYYCPDRSETVQGKTGSVLTHSCPAGSYCPSGSGTPLPCSPGYYNSTAGSTASTDCALCENGRYCPLSGHSAATLLCFGGFLCYRGNTIPAPLTFTTSGTTKIGGEACPAGSACPPGSSAPVPCAKGTYNPEMAQSSCRACDAGYLCSVVGSSTLTSLLLCPAGSYCLSGATAATPCPLGTYNPSKGAAASSDCLPCDPGSYCSTSGLVVPTGKCSVGYYCPGGSRSATENLCSAGQSCPAGSPKPDLCQPGSYCTSGTAVTGPCDPGYFCIAGSWTKQPTTASIGDVCPAGHYCPSGSSRPIPCPAGTFLSSTRNDDMSDCATCPGGHLCILPGSTNSSTRCPAGFYCPAGSTTAWDCQPGYYCPLGSASQLACPNGRYTTSYHSTSCDACPEGYNCVSGVPTPVPCGTGFYCPGGVAPQPCPAGTFNPQTGLSELALCRACTEGSYCQTAGLSAPTGACTAGFFCPAGTSTPTRECPSGHYCPTGSLSPTPCPVGTSRSGTRGANLAACAACLSGHYCPTRGLSSPLACLSGYACATEGIGQLTSTQFCPAGSYCPPSTATAPPCALGTYNPVLGSSSCRDCESGFECVSTGLSTPPLCALGHLCPTRKATAARLCPVNTYSGLAGRASSSCLPCLEGRQCGAGTGVPMTPCAAGQFCPQAPLANASLVTAPAPCPAGFFCVEGSSRPEPCPSGRYSTQTGLSSAGACPACPASKYCPQTATSLPVPCPAGFWCASGSGALTHAMACPTGSSCSAGSSAPATCAVNSYAPQTGHAACLACPDAFECDLGAMGSSDPTPCQPGHMCVNASSVACLAGSYAPFPGNSRPCYSCPSGWVCDVEGLKNYTTVCPAGYYCPPGSHVGNNTECPPGHYCPDRSSLPIPCPSGTINDASFSTSLAACLPCPAGNYCPDSGLTSATAPLCPAGFFCPAGTKTPTDALLCPQGARCPAGSSSSSACSAGEFNPDPGRSVCLACPAGYLCASVGLWDLSGPSLLCPPGSYCPMGSLDPLLSQCPAGTFNPITGLQTTSQCEKCPPGSFCALPGASSVASTPCQAGYYCRSASTTATPDGSVVSVGGPCPVGHYCPEGSPRPMPCPIDTSSNVTRATTVGVCARCTGGSYCPKRGDNGSSKVVCPAGFVCDGSDPASAFVPCPAGFYCPAGSGSASLSCGANEYCASGSVEAFPCPAGYERPSSSAPPASSCFECAAGYFCPPSTTAFRPSSGTISYLPSLGRVACPAGTYSTRTGLTSATSCAPCPPGKHCPAAPTVLPVECPAGYFCPGASASGVERECPAGHFCPAGSESPEPCARGFFNSAVRSVSVAACVACSAGRYCPSRGTSADGAVCPEGYMCVAGTWNLAQPSSQCTTGHFCPAGSSSESVCAGGTYQNEPLRGACKSCPAGFQCDAGASSPVLCSAGFFCPTNSSSSPLLKRQPCPAGTYGPFGGLERADQCHRCPAGRLCAGSGASTPGVPCPAGSYCPVGSSASVTCPAGSYCPESSHYPVPCPAGRFGASSGLLKSEDCTLCPAGVYCAHWGLTAPSGSCPAGFFCPSGTTSPSDLCPVHHRCPAGSGAPVPCSAGSFTLSLGSSACSACPTGFFCSGSDLQLCPAGSYCPSGSSAGVACPSGSFSSAQGLGASSECWPCPGGRHCNASGLSSSVGLPPCVAGFYCIAGQSAASPPTPLLSGYIGSPTPGTPTQGGSPCPTGHYCPEGSAHPTPCPLGSFRASTGGALAADCTPCASPNYCPQQGDPSGVHACQRGFSCGVASLSIPVDSCPAHSSCPANSGAAVPCAAGTYQPIVGSWSCAACPSRYFCDAGLGDELCEAFAYCPAGSSSATSHPCPAGTFSLNVGLNASSQCPPCPPGYYCAAVGTTSPQPCPGGSYCPVGSSAARTCPAGAYCPTSSSSPVLCPPGTFNSVPGASNLTACLPCTASFICPYAGTTAATLPCPAGLLCPAGSANASQLCPAGSSCSSAWPTARECAEGSFQNREGQSTCQTCPERFFCEVGASLPQSCPLGSFCPGGTGASSIALCPVGTIATVSPLRAAVECVPCPPGKYCAAAGLQFPTDDCQGGFFCTLGSMTGTPDGSVASVGGPCPANFYCPPGSSSPTPCPAGTYSPLGGLVAASECQACPSGRFCYFNGSVAVETPCWPGFVCGGGDGHPKSLCPAGHKCGLGQSSGTPCPAGEYQLHIGQSSCGLCPDGYTCPLAGTVSPSACPAGSFCSPSTPALGSPCPVGTYSGRTGLNASAQCLPCLPGYYCPTPGTVQPSQKCGAGAYCSLGASVESPASLPAGGPCREGFLCLGGASVPNPVSNSFTSAQLCPINHFCLAGAKVASECAAGAYNPIIGRSACFSCPAGYACRGPSSPSQCSLGRYCPPSTEDGRACPNGTFGRQLGLSEPGQCSPCRLGKYCSDMVEQGSCSAGYICYSNSSSATPSYSLCPKNYYCEEGSLLPRRCPDGKVTLAPGGASVADCVPCPRGYLCSTGDVTSVPCYRGYYCPDSGTAVACNATSYNALEGQYAPSSCLPCPAGSFCNDTGVWDPLQYPCPPGHYCLEGASESIPCMNGTHRSTPSGAQMSDCLECPPGHFCTSPSSIPVPCPSGYYCPPSSPVAKACPGGYFCPPRASNRTICPKGSYCPKQASGPLSCPIGTYCPEGTEMPTDCPKGTYSPSLSSSSSESCLPCPPGTYGYNTTYCETCPAGYVCLGGTASSAPTDAAREKGYACPKGSYCPEGSWLEVPCPPGTYGIALGYQNVSECLLCPENYYNPYYGKEGCYICSKSAYAPPGSTNCLCKGAHRVFQPSDGTCVCEPLFEYYYEFKRETGDSNIDCQPIVYSRCGDGQIRNSEGVCVDHTKYCTEQCPGGRGVYLYSAGLCECSDVPYLDSVCDAACRASAPLVSINSRTGDMELKDSAGTVVSVVPWKSMNHVAGRTVCSRPSVYNDPRGCLLRTVLSDASQGFVGSYLPPPALPGSSSVRDASQSVERPLICIEVGDGVLWDTTHSYPVYVKDSLLNSNPDFDYGEFSRLEYLERQQLNISLFSFTFSDSGSYVFSPHTMASSVLVVMVVPSGSTCPIPAISPQKEQQFVSVHSKRVEEVHLAPNWPTIITIIAGLFVGITIVIGTVYQLRRRSWGEKVLKTHQFRVKEAEYVKKIKHYAGTYADVQRAIAAKEITEDELKLQIDLYSEDMDMKQLFLQINEHDKRLSETARNMKDRIGVTVKTLNDQLGELRKLLLSLSLNPMDPNKSKNDLLVSNFALYDHNREQFKAQTTKLERDVLDSFTRLYQALQCGTTPLAQRMVLEVERTGSAAPNEGQAQINGLTRELRHAIQQYNSFVGDQEKVAKKYDPIISALRTSDVDGLPEKLQKVQRHHENEDMVSDFNRFLTSTLGGESLPELDLTLLPLRDDQGEMQSEVKLVDHLKKQLAPLFDSVVRNYPLLVGKVRMLDQKKNQPEDDQQLYDDVNEAKRREQDEESERQRQRLDRRRRRSTMQEQLASGLVSRKHSMRSTESDSEGEEGGSGDSDEAALLGSSAAMSLDVLAEDAAVLAAQRRLFVGLSDLVGDESLLDDASLDDETRRELLRGLEEDRKNHRAAMELEREKQENELKAKLLEKRMRLQRRHAGELSSEMEASLAEKNAKEQALLTQRLVAAENAELERLALEVQKKSEDAALAECARAYELEVAEASVSQERAHQQRLAELEQASNAQLETDLAKLRAEMEDRLNVRLAELEAERKRRLKGLKVQSEIDAVNADIDRRKSQLLLENQNELTERERDLQLRARQRHLDLVLEEEANYESELERIKSEFLARNSDLRDRLLSEKEAQRKMVGDKLASRRKRKLERLQTKEAAEREYYAPLTTNDAVDGTVDDIIRESSHITGREAELRKQEEAIHEKYRQLAEEQEEEERRRLAETERRSRDALEARLREESEDLQRQEAEVSDEVLLKFLKEEHQKQLTERRAALEGEWSDQRSRLSKQLEARQERGRRRREAREAEELSQAKSQFDLQHVQERLEKERSAIKARLLSGQLGESTIGEAIDGLLLQRHMDETEGLLLRQFAERGAALQDRLDSFFESKHGEKLALLRSMKASGVPLQEQEERVYDFESQWYQRQRDVEASCLQELYEAHEQQKRELSDRQVQERIGLLREFSKKEVFEKEMQRFETERDEFLEKLEERQAQARRQAEAAEAAQRAAFESELAREQARLQAEYESLMESGKQKIAESIERQRQLVLPPMPELDMIEDEEERKRLMEEYQKSRAQLDETLREEAIRQQRDMSSKLASRRENRLKHKAEEQKRLVEESARKAAALIMPVRVGGRRTIPVDIVLPSALGESEEGGGGLGVPSSGSAAAGGASSSASEPQDVMVTAEMMDPSMVLRKLMEIEQTITGMSDPSSGFGASASASSSAPSTSSGPALYHDKLDEAFSQPEYALVEMDPSSLSAREENRLRFANDLLEMLGVDRHSISEIVPATSLPVSNYGSNIFRNSFYFTGNTIYLRKERLGNAGDLMFVVVHIVSHYQLGDGFSDDTSPRFITQLIDNLKRVTEALFVEAEEAKGGGGGGGGGLGGVSSGVRSSSEKEEFSWESSRARIQRYVDFLTRNR